MNPDDIKPTDFVYCDVCEKGFIGSKTFAFVKSDHAGHRFRIVSRQKIEIEVSNENNPTAKDGIRSGKVEEDFPF